MSLVEKVKTNRLPNSNPALLPVINDRFSPRVFSAQPLTEAEINSIIEAARLAPSSRNGQPWFYFIAPENSACFQDLLRCFPDRFSWIKDAACLIVASVGFDLPTDSPEIKWKYYDVGLSVMSAVLEAQHLGIYTRQVGMFDPEMVKNIIGAENDWQPLTILVMGKLGSDQDYEKIDQELLNMELEKHQRRAEISRQLD